MLGDVYWRMHMQTYLEQILVSHGDQRLYIHGYLVLAIEQRMHLEQIFLSFPPHHPCKRSSSLCIPLLHMESSLVRVQMINTSRLKSYSGCTSQSGTHLEQPGRSELRGVRNMNKYSFHYIVPQLYWRMPGQSTRNKFNLGSQEPSHYCYMYGILEGAQV